MFFSRLIYEHPILGQDTPFKMWCFGKLRALLISLWPFCTWAMQLGLLNEDFGLFVFNVPTQVYFWTLVIWSSYLLIDQLIWILTLSLMLSAWATYFLMTQDYALMESLFGFILSWYSRKLINCCYLIIGFRSLLLTWG